MSSKRYSNTLEKVFLDYKLLHDELVNIDAALLLARARHDQQEIEEMDLRSRAFKKLQEAMIHVNKYLLHGQNLEATSAVTAVRELLRPEQQHWNDDTELRRDEAGVFKEVAVHTFFSMSPDEKVFRHVALLGIAMEWHISEESVRNDIPRNRRELLKQAWALVAMKWLEISGRERFRLAS